MNEQELFLSALEIDDPAERRAHVQAVCVHDPELLSRVESLLASHESQSQFLNKPIVDQMIDEHLDQPADECAATIAYEKNSTQDDEFETTDLKQGENEAMTQNLDSDRDDEIPLGYLEPSSKPDSIGRLAHYEILEVVGRGAFGTVLKAFDEKLHRVVAIKVLSPEMASTSPARKRFLREARSSAAVRHDNVVSIYAVEDEPIPYLVMEYIPGQTLQQRLDEHGPLDVGNVLRLGKQIADGLAAAHAQGLIHRDIKPGNILLETSIDDHVKITDFGLARTADDASMTQSGMIAGTPLYMAPEQAQGEKLDQRADLFSLGSVLYQMLSGRPPFRAPNTVAVLKRVVEDDPRPIQEIIPEVPLWMCELIGHLHAKDPDERYSSAREVSDALAQCLVDVQEGRKPDIAVPAAPVTAETVLRPALPIQSRPATRSAKMPLARAAAIAFLLLIALGFTEATGVTRLAPTVVRLFTGSGTLVIEIDDPSATVAINGEEVTIRGAGVDRVTLRPGEYEISASKDGRTVKQELVTITRNGQTVVRLSLEGDSGSDATREATADRHHVPVAADNYALSFDAPDERIELPTLGNQLDQGPLTIEGYVTLSRGEWPPEERVNLFMDSSSVLAQFQLHQSWRFWRATGATGRGIIADDRPATGVRTHVAAVWDGKQQMLFVDGQSQGVSEASIGGVVLRPAFVPSIGGIGSANRIAEMAPYELDEFRISKIARYSESFTPAARFQPDEHTLALYHFDEGAGEILKDASDNGHDGKIFGAKWVRPNHRQQAVESSAESSQDWVQLFNGKDLTGWKKSSHSETTWTWADGVLSGEGTGELATERSDYGNFHLRMNIKANSHGGAYIHVRDARGGNEGDHYVTSIRTYSEPNILYGGGLTGVRNGKSAGLVTNYRVGSVDQWHLFEIIVVGNRVRTLVNGRTTADFTDSESTRVRSGIVLDLNHQFPGGAHFKNVEIKELPPSNLLGTDAPPGTTVGLPNSANSTSPSQWPADAPPSAIAPFDAEQAQAHQEAWAKYLGVPVEQEISLGQDKDGKDVMLTMVLIPPGEFMIGATDQEQVKWLSIAKAAHPNAKPDAFATIAMEDQKFVRITKPFWLSKLEFKTGQFRRFVESTDYRTDAETSGEGAARPARDKTFERLPELNWDNWGRISVDAGPVVNISWNDAAKCCEWLSNQHPDMVFSLPTEAQWEFACRAGTRNSLYDCDTSEELRQYAQFGDEVRFIQRGGQLRPNAFGMYDMLGNVTEWCSDWLAGYGQSPTDDPAGPAVPGKYVMRAIRGGSFMHELWNVRSSKRDFYEPDNCFFDRGFRVAAVFPDDEHRTRGIVSAPFTDVDVARIVALSAEEQIEEVCKELQKCNPGFDGEMPHRIEDGTVVDLKMDTDHITDISPVRALVSLKSLTLESSEMGQLVDLSALKGMQLSSLTITSNPVRDLSPLHGMPLTSLWCHNLDVTDLTPLEGMPLEHLFMSDCEFQNLEQLKGLSLKTLGLFSTPVSDLSPLAGQPIEVLNLAYCSGVRSLAPLTGMPLRQLNLDDTGVTDLSPLAEAPLEDLCVRETGVRDLSPLTGMPLKILDYRGTPVTDISVLKGLSLVEVRCTFRPERDAEVLRSISSLKTIGDESGMAAHEFWKNFDESLNMKRITALPPARQIEEIRKELQLRNPDFGGELIHKIEEGAVVELKLDTDHVTDISPLRALVSLKSLSLQHVTMGELTDISPLKGMSLSRLNLTRNPVSDLSPLRGMPLKYVLCHDTKISDLSPLKGMPLEELSMSGCLFQDLTQLKEMPLKTLALYGNPISDLSPLRGMQIEFLNLAYCPDVTSLEPLAGMSLKELNLDGTRVTDLSPIVGAPLNNLCVREAKVSDLSPLKGMPLRIFDYRGTSVTDISALRDLPLEEVRCTFQRERDAEILRSIPTLKTIVDSSSDAIDVKEFWKKFDESPDAEPDISQ